MIKAEKFLISKALYAIKPDSLRLADPHPDGYGWWSLDAVWFKRKHGVTSACMGYLTDLRRLPPADLAEFLADHKTDPWGGRCRAKWNGESLWSEQLTRAEEEVCLQLLRPMLDNYPGTPGGYEGWWKFE